MSSSETSGQLNPGSKAYLYSYLQNTDWYKARLQSLSGAAAFLASPAQDQPQQTPQSTTRAQDSAPPAQNQGRPRITGQIANVDQENRSFSLRTERGDLTLKLPRTAPLPPEGLRIEIELPRNKGGAPPREGQNIAFRPLPQNSQPVPIQQQINDAVQPVPEDGMPVPPFKPSTPLVDTPQTPHTENKAFVPMPPKLENGAVIIVRTVSAAQIRNIQPLPSPSAQPQTALSAPQHTPSTTQTIVDTADQAAKPAAVATPSQPNPAITGFRLNIPAPNQTPAMQPDLVTFFTNTENAAAILRGTGVQTTTAAPEITVTPATPETAPRPSVTTPPAPVTNATITTAATTTKPAPAQTLTTLSTTAREEQPTPPQAIKIETAALPQTPGASVTGEPQASPSSNVQRGEIVGKTEQDRPVMAVRSAASGDTSTTSSPVRYYALDMPATNIAQGTQVNFTETAPPQNVQPTIPQAAAIAAQAQSITFSPHATWPALDDIAQTLQMTAPQQAQALMNQSPNVQNPAMKMEPAILFFLAAARSGDVSGWLGSQSTEALRQAGKSDTLNRIMSDFRALSRPSQESGSPVQNAPEWRSMPLPLFAYNEAHKIMLHYKYDGSAQQNDGESDKNAMRFVIDLEMTQMGDVQLDGFAQKERLDLIVRTHQPLSPEMQQIMRRKYSGPLEATGFHGELGFHGNPDKFIKIEPATATDQSGFSV